MEESALEIESVVDAEAPDEGTADAAASRRDPPEMLLDLQVTRWDILCVGPILLSTLYSLLGQPITPALLGSHPILAAFLRGSVPAMLLSGALSHGGSVPLWQAI